MTPLLPDQIYHVYNHANGQDVLFREPDNYRYFLDKYAYHIHPVAETYAYCLLPNHLHLMIRIRSEDVLMEVFKEKLALRPDRFPKPVRSIVCRVGDLQGFNNLGGLWIQLLAKRIHQPLFNDPIPFYPRIPLALDQKKRSRTTASKSR